MQKMQITTVTLGALQTNCYFLTNAQTKETVVIDPAENFPQIRGRLSADGFTPVAVLLTHGHFDHMTAADETKKAFGIPVCAAATEQSLLADPRKNGSALTGKETALTADTWIADGENLLLGGFNISVISTPGHTAGSVCYYIKDENALISGDTLFKSGVGRTDLPTGNYSALIYSITRKLFTLPDITDVYPGHGGKTTIASEKNTI
jgi:glyoxylase-like metal-dependent hydrolase (beta-lactamase superfamily II)